MTKLEKLNFRGVEAESDEILIDCFTPTGDYRRISELGSAVILGQKGSGKTAIIRKLITEAGPEALALDLSPDEDLWRQVVDFRDQAGDGPFAAMHAWQLHILLGIVVKSVLNGESGEELERARTYLMQRQLEVDQGRKYDTESLRRLVSSLSCALFRSLAGDSRAELVALEGLVDRLLADDRKAVVAVDRVDVFWDNSPGANKGSLGLLHAWKDADLRFPKLMIRLSMRSDMYRVLRFAEHDKIQTKIVELRWDSNRLRTLLARRISYCLYGNASDSLDILEEVFPAVVTGVRGYAGTQDTFGFMLKLVHDRPRDLLLLCSLAKEHAGQEAEAFPDWAIVKAEQLFSEQKRIGMEKEYGFELPGIPAVLQALSRARARIGGDALEKRLLPICREQKMEFRDLATRLVQFGILGVYVEDEEVYFYQDPTIVGQVALRSTVFVVHRSLRPALRIVEYRAPMDSEAIQSHHRNLVALRYKVNETCKKQGMDEVFRATSETEVVAAEPKEVTDAESFGGFIDDMYMFVYESAGGMNLRIPPEFLKPDSVVFDIKHLRTDVRHDTEHGDESEIRKKEARMGEAYLRYIGKRLPQDERDWLKLQAGIYDALQKLMSDLLASFSGSQTSG